MFGPQISTSDSKADKDPNYESYRHDYKIGHLVRTLLDRQVSTFP